MSVIGADPGTGGALAHWFYEFNYLEIIDMPTFIVTVTRSKRERIDPVALRDYFALAKAAGAERFVTENVSARPQQSGMFAFGRACGMLYQAAVDARIPVDEVTPTVWKKFMGVPGKDRKRKKEDMPVKLQVLADEEEDKALAKQTRKEDNAAAVAALIKRADETFPNYTHLWRSAKGAFKVDRAEAALIAKFGEHLVKRTA